ncbi:ABC transporter ATP-binding protein [Paenibacillus thalictri]|uniref:ATP-binding cassette domain-containing protein n=1 Tax=Paenibacillus thalictri TaxID=2527873 RepID=A0A4Q9DWV4_9BACL|nr:ATP-binding cassette domain-containing protein [Paenibacillus thalictri]TBL80237.1 ATP-binding cassette domain-containing protein [Paenibacillus thalictri]
MIELNGIHFIREERHILKDVNVTVSPGEHWVILGRNGSGKTTLLELITAYQFPSKGKVHVLGNTYGQVDIREVRKQIGYISQSLFEKMTLRDPVWEVVATGEYSFLRFYQEIPEEVKAKAISMLERVNLAHVQNQTLGTLSQGERKKIMLARALMQSPQILIMDEPCSGLDLYEREKLLHDINELQSQKICVIYVTHHIEEIMPMFTHVLLIEQGEVIAAGPKHEVVTPEHLYQAFQVKLDIDWHLDRPWIKVQ